MRYLKKLIFTLTIMIIVVIMQSCRTSIEPFPQFFKNTEAEPYCQYLVFQTEPKIFILYSSGLNILSYNLIGTWSVRKDTVICTPKIECSGYRDVVHLNNLEPKDSTIMTVERRFLYRRNRMEDITDINPLHKSCGLPLINYDSVKPIVYYRFK